VIRKALVELTGGLRGAHCTHLHTMPWWRLLAEALECQSVTRCHQMSPDVTRCHEVSAIPVPQEVPGVHSTIW